MHHSIDGFCVWRSLLCMTVSLYTEMEVKDIDYFPSTAKWKHNSTSLIFSKPRKWTNSNLLLCEGVVQRQDQSKRAAAYTSFVWYVNIEGAPLIFIVEGPIPNHNDVVKSILLAAKFCFRGIWLSSVRSCYPTDNMHIYVSRGLFDA